MNQPQLDSLRFDPFLDTQVVYAIWERGKLIATCGPVCYAQDRKLCTCACEGRHHGVGINTAHRMALAHVLAIGCNSGIEPLVTADYIMATIGNRQYYARNPF